MVNQTHADVKETNLDVHSSYGLNETPYAKKKAEYFYIKHEETGKVLDVCKENRTAGTKVVKN